MPNTHNAGITKQGSWHRKCSCGRITTYSHLQGYYRAKKNNSLCRNCTMSLRRQSEETKLKRRLQKCRKYGAVGFNPVACRIFDEINAERGWVGVHAQNGGEFQVVGYFVDYYEPNLNLVVEYDEKHHRKQSRMKRDKERQERIVAALNCRFIRIPEGTDWRNLIPERYK